MRNTLFIIVGIFVVTPASTSYAFDDGFGDRFYNQAPAALGEYEVEAEEAEMQDIAMDDLASELQNIQPAAGEEEASELEEASE